MIEGRKTHLNERKGMAKKRTILIDDWGVENTLEYEGKNGTGKHPILVDDRGLENTLEDEGKMRLESTLF